MLIIPYIAGNFRGQADFHEVLMQAWGIGTYKCCAGNETKRNFYSQKSPFSPKISLYGSHFLDNIFVIAVAKVHINTVGKVTSFVGKIFVVRPSTTKTTKITL